MKTHPCGIYFLALSMVSALRMRAHVLGNAFCNPFFMTLLWVASVFCVHAQEDLLEQARAYAAQGLDKKAIRLYEKVLKQPEPTQQIQKEYVALLVRTKRYSKAEKFLYRKLKEHTHQMLYHVELLKLWIEQGEDHKADEYFRRIVKKVKGSAYDRETLAHHLSNEHMMQRMLYLYREARAASSQSDAFALSLARVYWFLDQKEEALLEYAKYAKQKKSNLTYVKNTLKRWLTLEAELRHARSLLLGLWRRNPDNQEVFELLVWSSLQLGDFSAAFRDAAQVDKRRPLGPLYFLEMGKAALDSEAYKESLSIFAYIGSQYRDSDVYVKATYYVLEAQKGLILNTLPLEKEAIARLAAAYKEFVLHSKGYVLERMEAQRQRALLYARYLDHVDTARMILNVLVKTAQRYPAKQAQYTLDLADMYLLSEDKWEALLLYAQIERTCKYREVVEQAKLKSSQAAYYQGEFRLAKARLDIFKAGTSRKIANDALALSYLIGQYFNESGEDSTYAHLKAFAAAEFELLRYHLPEAARQLEALRRQALVPVLDIALHDRLADIYMKEGRFDEALSALDHVLDSDNAFFKDRALFLKAQVFEKGLGQKSEAIKIYRKFIVSFADSIYIAVARTRLEALLREEKG